MSAPSGVNSTLKNPDLFNEGAFVLVRFMQRTWGQDTLINDGDLDVHL